MSILDFMEMSVSGSLFSCLIAIFICLSFAGIGEFFLKGRHGIVLHSVVGITFVAALVTFFAGFCAALCKYIIYISVFIGIYFTLKNILQKKRTLSDFYALVPIFIFLGIVLYRLFELITIKNGIFHYNSHLPYFSGIAIEIFKADYFSRIRIIDAYPYEWSKYHFFTGSSIAIPLVAFAQKNYISYLMSKFVLLAFLGGAIFDCLREKYDLKKAVLTFLFGFGLFFLYDRFLWCIFTQSFNTVLFFVLLCFMFEFGVNIAAGGQLLFSLALALSKGGSALTGGCLFLLSLYNILKTEKFQFIQFFKNKQSEKYFLSLILPMKQKYFSWRQFFKKYKFEMIAVFVFSLAILSMVFVGGKPADWYTKIGVSTLSEFADHFLDDFWFQFFSLTPSFIEYLSRKEVRLLYSSHYWLFYQSIFLFMMVYLLIRNRMNCLALFKNHKIFWSSIGISCVGLFFAFNSVLKTPAYVLAMIFLVYLLPCVTLLASIKKNLMTPLIIVVLSALTTNFLFWPSISAPNYVIINYWLFMTFIEQFTQDVFTNKKILQIIFCGLLIFGLHHFPYLHWQRLFFLSPTDYYHVSMKLQHIPNLGNQPFEVSSMNQLMLARLHALKGNRVHYRFILKNANQKPLIQVAMSFLFLPQGHEKLGYEKIKY